MRARRQGRRHEVEGPAFPAKADVLDGCTRWLLKNKETQKLN